MSSLLVTFAGALCLAVMVEGHASHGHRSCGLSQGVVCMPTVCSVAKCLLFKNATCVDDKCGCDGRFFTYIEKEKTYQDVTKMCTSGNVVLNFVNFTDSSLRQNDESNPQPRPFVRFFYHFNNLVTEILADLVAHLRLAAEKHPVQANIDLAKKASTTLENLKNMTEEHRAMWKAIIGLKDSDIVHDEDSVHDNRDEDEDAKSTVAHNAKFGEFVNGVIKRHMEATKVAHDEDEDEDGKTTGKKFTAAHKAKITQALTDILKKNPALLAQAQAAMKGVRDEDEDAHSAKIGEALNRIFQQNPGLLAQAKVAMKGIRDEDKYNGGLRPIDLIPSSYRKAAQTALQILKNDPNAFSGRPKSDEELEGGAPAASNSKLYTRRRDEEEDDLKTGSTMALFKAHSDVLSDMLSDEDYIPVGGHGKPGVLSDRAFFSSLIQTVLPVVKSIFGF